MLLGAGAKGDTRALRILGSFSVRSAVGHVSFTGIALLAGIVFTTTLANGSASAAAQEETKPATSAVSQPSTAQDADAEGNALPSSATALDEARNKIQHVVVIMQENRSFDHYFGTYPGVEGIPMQNGVPTVCVPDPQTDQCVK